MNNTTNKNATFITFLMSLFLFFPLASQAGVFQTCTPMNTLDILAVEACNAENKVYETWDKKLLELDVIVSDLTHFTNNADWKGYKEKWAEALPYFQELKEMAEADRTIGGAENLYSFYRQDAGYTLKNMGLGNPTNFGDASNKILAGLDGGKASDFATAGISLIQNIKSRSFEFLPSFAKAENAKIKQADSEVRRAKGQDNLDKLEGRTADGYFSGFWMRISNVWRPFLFLLFVTTFVGAWLGIKNKINPVTAASSAGLAYLIPGTIMALVLILAPMVSQLLLVLATIIATVITYMKARKIFGAVASIVGVDSRTGKRLIRLGETLENLRAGMSQSPTNEVEEMAADQSTHGSARWGTNAEISNAGHLTAQGFALARLPQAIANADTRFKFVGHVVTIAPTGSGKGIGAVIPNLLDYPGSALVLDVKGENAAVTARARRGMGHSVYTVDPFKITSGERHAFNILERLDPNDEDCVSYSSILADCLVIPDAKGGGKHFDDSAKTLLQGLMLHVVGLDDRSLRNLPEVRKIITSDEETFLNILADMAIDTHAAFGIPARAANTIMGMADRERSSVLSTARNNTSFLDDPRIADTLSRSDFDLSKIKSDLMTVYIVIPANKIEPNARFIRGLLGTAIQAVTATTTQPKYPIAFILDEFGQLGYMKQIEDAVSLLRGYGLYFWVFLQDLSQLKNVYPKWQTFLANSAKTFYGISDFDTAKYVSDSLGQATIEYETSSEGKNTGSGISGGGGSMNKGKNTGSSQQFAARNLLTPDEVMRLGAEKPIVLIKGEYPYLLKRLNYLVDSEYQGKADPNPYHS